MSTIKSYQDKNRRLCFKNGFSWQINTRRVLFLVKTNNFVESFSQVLFRLIKGCVLKSSILEYIENKSQNQNQILISDFVFPKVESYHIKQEVCLRYYYHHRVFLCCSNLTWMEISINSIRFQSYLYNASQSTLQSVSSLIKKRVRLYI